MNPKVPEWLSLLKLLKFLPLGKVAELTETKILNPVSALLYGGIAYDAPVLVVLAAGKGTRFGTEPKCIQPVLGKPLARHSIDAFRQISPSPAVCIVGYRHQEVAGALDDDNIYVRSENPTGGTAFAAFEALSVSPLLEKNPLLIISMGDRIVPPAIYQQLWNTHTHIHTHNGEQEEALLTLLTAHYEPPRNQGKGRILRDASGTVIGIREQKDIEAEADTSTRQQQLDLTEGNCPLYMIRAQTLHTHLAKLTNDNAQQQYYITDIIADIAKESAEQANPIRTITTMPTDPAYPLLCADVTRPEDLPRLEKILAEVTTT